MKPAIYPSPLLNTRQLLLAIQLRRLRRAGKRTVKKVDPHPSASADGSVVNGMKVDLYRGRVSLRSDLITAFGGSGEMSRWLCSRH